jgi:serine/threonine protein phosphatase PrpC
MRTITAMKPEYLVPALELVEEVFTEHENADEGKLVRRLVEEIRSKEFYLPELELLMLEDGEVVGYVMFSRFHIEGKYTDRLVLLSDGVWESEETQSLLRDSAQTEGQQLANLLVEQSVHRGSNDDMTVLVVDLFDA